MFPNIPAEESLIFFESCAEGGGWYPGTDTFHMGISSCWRVDFLDGFLDRLIHTRIVVCCSSRQRHFLGSSRQNLLTKAWARDEIMAMAVAAPLKM